MRQTITVDQILKKFAKRKQILLELYIISYGLLV